jgi:hypothetical protein
MSKARDLADRSAADLTAVSAGTGISVANGDGPIPTVTNTVATGFDAKGDLIVGTGADTFAKLTVASTAGYLLSVDSGETTGLKWSAPVAGGKVLQVVSTTKTDTFTSASTTYVDLTGLSATITPSSTSSKILVQIALIGSGTITVSFINYRMVRTSTAIGIGDTAGNRISGTGQIYADVNGTVTFGGGIFLDSPATTSSTTYKVQVAGNSAGTVYINRAQTDTDSATFGRYVSTITLFEIGA